jgi:hypothetical protein
MFDEIDKYKFIDFPLSIFIFKYYFKDVSVQNCIIIIGNLLDDGHVAIEPTIQLIQENSFSLRHTNNNVVDEGIEGTLKWNVSINVEIFPFPQQLLGG